MRVNFNHAGKLLMAFKLVRSSSIIRLFARVVKLVYTAGLKPAAANTGMPVRFRSLAPLAIVNSTAQMREIAAAGTIGALVSEFCHDIG